jgi:methyl-accepting chemotaxis protein
MKNIKISGKLIIVFAVIVTVVAATFVTIYTRLKAIDIAFQQNHVSRSIIIETNLALTALVEQQSAVRGYVATHDPSFLSRQNEFRANFEAANEELSRLVSDAGDKARVAKLQTDAARVKSEQDHLMDLSRDPATADEARAHLATVGRLAKARDDVKAILKPQQDLMALHAATLDAAVASASLTLMIGGALTVLLAIGLGWLLNRSIAHPVASMTAAMGRLSSGDTSVVIPAIGQRDEVGRMADAVQIFKSNAIEKGALEKTAEADRQVVEAERRKTENLRANQAQDVARVVEALGGGLARLSSGDLTYRIDAAFTEDYAKLKGDFNLTVNTLQNTMATIVGRAHGLRASGAEITQASNDLSKRTEQQAASLEETAAALDEITATVRRTADGAVEARNIVSQAKADAETSSQVVQDAVVAMTRIEESARQISQIIGVIDEIAFQTNLLALNAGVEAARAGDSGKGFAVVASEVRALAQRSAEAAREIKGLISASTDQVAHGVERVGATGQALARIAQQVAQINGVVTEITASAQEQATGLNQVNAAVNQMDQVTQQNAAMVEQATAAANALHEETDALSSLIAQFKVGDTGLAAQPALRRAAPVRTPSSPPKRSPDFGRRPTRSALAPAPAHAPADDASWEEF